MVSANQLLDRDEKVKFKMLLQEVTLLPLQLPSADLPPSLTNWTDNHVLTICKALENRGIPFSLRKGQKLRLDHFFLAFLTVTEYAIHLFDACSVKGIISLFPALAGDGWDLLIGLFHL